MYQTKIHTTKIAEDNVGIHGSCLLGWRDKLFAEFCGCKRSQFYVPTSFSFWYAVPKSLIPIVLFLNQTKRKKCNLFDFK